MAPYESQLGNTLYTLEENGNHILKISRHNYDGETTIFIPDRLVLDYVRDIVLMKRVTEVTDQVNIEIYGR